MGQIEHEPSINPLSVYMQDVGNAHPRLHEPEERLFAQLIARGRGAQETLEHTPNIKAEEQTHLLEAVDDAMSASTAMVEANLPLVVRIAARYVRPGDSLLDFIQEGNIGLMRAVDKYDAQWGTRLSTYATWTVRGCLSHTVSRNGHHQTVSLDRRIDAQSEGSLLDVIHDLQEEDPFSQANLRMELQSLIQTANLSSRELQILRLRFFDDQTLQETADALNVSKQCVHQQETRALKKLRRAAERQGLHGI